MSQRSFGHSDPGRVKKDNEDSILMAVESGLYVLCDGCGGHAAGKIAGKMTCNMTYEAIKANRAALDGYAEDPTPEKRQAVIDAIGSGVNAASERVWAAARSDPQKEGMATTVVVLTVMGNQAIVAHAGDSRLYLLRDGKAHQLTEDHTMATRYVKMALLTPKQAAESPAGGRLLRAVGFHEHARLDTLHFELAPGDRLLLCSDGLSRYLAREEMAGMIEAGPLPQVPHKMVRLANKRGGADNVSVIVVDVEPDPQAPDAGDLNGRLRALQNVPLFRNLTYVELLRVTGAVHVESYKAGTRIVTEGRIGDRLFVSLSGEVEVVKNQHTLARLPVGSLFGEMGFLDGTERSADVVAVGDVRAMAIGRDDLIGMLRRDRTMAVRVLWGLCRVLNRRLYATSEELSSARSSLARLDQAECPIVEDTDQPPPRPEG
ncbi:MAG: cyclic nucleotide-binding domain-containing protein, partial [Phycisphaerae bacterium]